MGEKREAMSLASEEIWSMDFLFTSLTTGVISPDGCRFRRARGSREWAGESERESARARDREREREKGERERERERE